jgi:predicted ATPase
LSMPSLPDRPQISICAPQEAQLRKGLDLVAGLPESTERQQFELDLQVARSTALVATQSPAPLVAESFVRARQLCDQLVRPSQLAVVLAGQCAYHLGRAELVLSCQESTELLDLGKAHNDAAVKLAGCAFSAGGWFHLGDFTAARAYAEQALALYDPAHPPVWASPTLYDPLIWALIYSFRSQFYLGYLDQARLRRNEALAQARQLTYVHTLASLLGTGLVDDVHMQSDPAILLLHADELAILSAEHGFPHWAAVAKWYRGWCLLGLGRAEEGLALQTEARSAFRATTGALIGRPSGLTLLADAFAKAARPTEGLEQLDRATRKIEVTDERWAEADTHRVRGELLITIGDAVAAEKSLYQAIGVARRRSAKLWELRAATSLARLWCDQGKRTEARDLLAPVYGWFTEGFDTPVLKDAKALLDQLA